MGAGRGGAKLRWHSGLYDDNVNAVCVPGTVTQRGAGALIMRGCIEDARLHSHVFSRNLQAAVEKQPRAALADLESRLARHPG